MNWHLPIGRLSIRVWTLDGEWSVSLYWSKKSAAEKLMNLRPR